LLLVERPPAIAKYDSLTQHLTREELGEVTLTFNEIEVIVGARLPAGASTYRFWRSPKKDTRHLRYQSWRSAGFDALWVPPKKVRFKRAR
jgi:hypothetical protein